MKFLAEVVNPDDVVVSLSIELNLHEATRLIDQLGEIKEGLTPWPASMVSTGLRSVVLKIKEQVTEELVPERNQS